MSSNFLDSVSERIHRRRSYCSHRPRQPSRQALPPELRQPQLLVVGRSPDTDRKPRFCGSALSLNPAEMQGLCFLDKSGRVWLYQSILDCCETRLERLCTHKARTTKRTLIALVKLKCSARLPPKVPHNQISMDSILSREALVVPDAIYRLTLRCSIRSCGQPPRLK